MRLARVGDGAEGARVNGFGWSFYGFFVAAAAWIAIYFAWAVRQR